MQISPLGENALTVSFGNVISEDMNRKAIALCRELENAPFPGMIEAVPAYASATVFFDLVAVRKALPDIATAFEAVAGEVQRAMERIDISKNGAARPQEIPIYADADASLDLSSAAASRNLRPGEFLEVFLERTYRVFMIGFLPGFAYMGEVDERIAVPRLKSPRTKVPKGSIGIAGTQTGIYPQDSPGGWQIIGRTDAELFDPTSAEPCMFRAGDEVRFVRV